MTLGLQGAPRALAASQRPSRERARRECAGAGRGGRWDACAPRSSESPELTGRIAALASPLLPTVPSSPQAPGSAPSAVGREWRGQLCASAVRSRVCLLGEIFQGPNAPDPISTELQKPCGRQDLAAGLMVDVQLSATLCTLILNYVCFSSIKWT